MDYYAGIDVSLELASICVDLHRFYGERFCSYPANLSN